MAGFPPNLDDGELWLPSDIFRNEIVPSRFNSYRLPCMDMDLDMEIHKLGQRFAALNFFQRNRSPATIKPPPFLLPRSVERLRPVSSYDSFESHPPGYLKVNLKDGHGIYGYVKDASASVANLKPLCRHQLLRAAQAQTQDKNPNSSTSLSSSFTSTTPFVQVEKFLEARSRILQEQKNRIQSRSPPPPTSFQGNRLRSRTEAGAVRGTGVFLPRVVNTTTSTTTADLRKKQGMRIKQDFKSTQQRNCTNKMNMSNNLDYYYQQNPEMSLPKDWTY